MSHAYHPNCGCDGCCRIEAADERAEEAAAAREEAIKTRVVALVAERRKDIDACSSAIVDVPRESWHWMLKDAGAFFARFEAADDDRAMAQAGYQLFCDLSPYLAAALKEAATEDAGAEYDAEQNKRPKWWERVTGAAA